MKRILLLLTSMTAFVIAPAAWAQTSTPTAAPEMITISAVVYQTTNLREGPDTRYEILGRLAQDDTVQVFERESESARWLHVITETGATGWIPAFTVALEEGRSLEELPIFEAAFPNPGVDGIMTATAYGRVNVRSGPAIQYTIVGTLDVGDQVTVTARSNTLNDWLFIETDALEGWIAFFTVQVNGDPNTLPVLVPDSAGEALVSPSQILRARFNVRLHDAPSADALTIIVIPFNSRVTLLARTADGEWLYVDFDGVIGWGAADLFSTPPDLESIPVYSPDATPEPTAEATPDG